MTADEPILCVKSNGKLLPLTAFADQFGVDHECAKRMFEAKRRGVEMIVLEAVGQEWDGEYRPIQELSYAQPKERTP